MSPHLNRFTLQTLRSRKQVTLTSLTPRLPFDSHLETLYTQKLFVYFFLTLSVSTSPSFCLTSLPFMSQSLHNCHRTGGVKELYQPNHLSKGQREVLFEKLSSSNYGKYRITNIVIENIIRLLTFVVRSPFQPPVQIY